MLSPLVWSLRNARRYAGVVLVYTKPFVLFPFCFLFFYVSQRRLTRRSRTQKEEFPSLRGRHAIATCPVKSVGCNPLRRPPRQFWASFFFFHNFLFYSPHHNPPWGFFLLKMSFWSSLIQASLSNHSNTKPFHSVFNF